MSKLGAKFIPAINPFLFRLLVAFFIAAVVFTGCSSSKKAIDPNHKFDPAALQEDVSALWTTFQHCHPSLYWYSSEEEVKNAFDSLLMAVNDSMTLQQFRMKMAETLAHVHCGHTSVRGSKISRRQRQKLKPLSFPLHLKVWDRDSMVIVVNMHRDDSILTRGTVVHSIDGKPAGEIVDTLCRFISADGLHQSFRYQLLSNNFPAWYNAVFGVKKNYMLAVTDTNGVTSDREVKVFDPALSDSLLKMQTNKYRWIKQNPGPPAPKRSRFAGDRSLRIDSVNSVAIMQLNTFSFARLRHFFHHSFRKMKEQQIQNLVIELRENGGGNIANSTLLTRYLSDHPFKVADTVVAASFHYPIKGIVKNGLAYKIQSWFVCRRGDDGRLHYRMYERKHFKPKKRLHFAGNVFLITGGFTFSASTLFINPLKGQSNVTVLGEETGGGAYGNSAVNIPDIHLPNTKLRVRLPLYRIVINKNLPNNGRGIIPDIEVPPTSWHLAHRLDPKMMKVYKIIKEGKSKQTPGVNPIVTKNQE